MNLPKITWAQSYNRPKLFEIIFEFCSQQIMILQLLTSQLIPKFSRNSNKNLLFKVCKVFEFRKIQFDHDKGQNRNFCLARMKVYDLGYFLLGWISSGEYAGREKT